MRITYSILFRTSCGTSSAWNCIDLQLSGYDETLPIALRHVLPLEDGFPSVYNCDFDNDSRLFSRPVRLVMFCDVPLTMPAPCVPDLVSIYIV